MGERLQSLPESEVYPESGTEFDEPLDMFVPGWSSCVVPGAYGQPGVRYWVQDKLSAPDEQDALF